VRGVFDFEEISFFEFKPFGDHIIRERLYARIKAVYLVIVILTGECNLIFRRCNFFMQLYHLAVSFQVGIVLGNSKQTAQCSCQEILCFGFIFEA